ncbi:PQQ-binding-like beta-propeller repeat protein [Mucilaginibacter sp.]|uniref:outer membrane protein assembly factor BamB family protein n=1 Tax=Mucilaginibacter sp. TaxID=1882438 RepID=UPI00326491AC
MKKICYLSLFLVLYLIGCQKDNVENLPDKPNKTDTIAQALSFKFIGLKRKDRRLVDISWTDATGSGVDTTLKYSVSLNGKVIAANLKTTTYTLTDIYATIAYPGQITATNSKGLSVKVNFNIDTEKGFIYSNSDAEYFSCYTVDGLFVWEQKIGLGSFAAISNDTLFVQGHVLNYNTAAIYALDIKTGQIDWFKDARLPYYPDFQDVIYDHGVVYEVGKTEMYAFDSRNGQQLWHSAKFHLDKPIAANGVLYCLDYDVANNYYLRAYDGRSGIEKWHYKTRDVVLGLPIESNGAIYMIEGHPTGNFSSLWVSDMCSFDAKTGVKKVMCRLRGSPGYEGPQSRPLVIGNNVFVSLLGDTGSENNLFAIDKTTERVIWEGFAGNGYLTGDAANLFVYSLPYAIHKIDIKAGKPIWQKDNVPEYMVFSPEKLLLHNDIASHYGSLTPTPFKVYNNQTGNSEITSLPGIKMVGPFTLILNGNVYYLPQSGMHRGHKL